MDLKTPMGQLGLDAREELRSHLTEELGAQVKTAVPGDGIKAAAFALQSAWTDGISGEEWRAAASRALSLDQSGPVNIPEPVPLKLADPPPPAEPERPAPPPPADPPEEPEEEDVKAPEPPPRELARELEAGHSRTPGRTASRNVGRQGRN